jgi:peptidoglycan/xylan/chitin deacetylase (PgdA/CDA1 family)
MDPVSPLRRREVETYFGVIAQGGPERRIMARSFHVLGEFERPDYDRLAGVLADADATASVSLLGRDADRFAGAMSALADAGHELVCHGHRHIACADADYDLAHENLSRGIAAITDATGVTPRGFVSPGQDVSGATLRAAGDLGLDYVLGRSDATAPAGLDLREPAHPYDLVYLNEGARPTAVFERIRAQTESGTTHLVHPNMLDYYDATDAFDAWVAETSPVSVERVVDGDEGVGLLVDAMRPLRVV